MMKTSEIRGMTKAGALVLGVLLAACGDDRDAQARAAEGGMVVATATPDPAARTTITPEVGPVVDSAPPPRFTNVAYADAESVFRKGRYAESAEMFGVYVTENPANAFGHYMHGLSAWKSGDHESAEASLRKAAELNGETVKIRTNLGRVLLERSRAADALPHLEKAVELDPGSNEVWRVMGNVYAQLGRSADAIDAYRQALMLNDHDSWTMNNYGLLLLQLGRYEDALLPLARATELVPRSATFQNNLGAALERIGELGGARAAWAAAVEADSTHARATASLERVESRLVGTSSEAPDVSAYARQFVIEMESWFGEDQHDC
jgi:Flp pilus assembly protein TadD